MQPRFIQINCREQHRRDLRRAKAVLTHQPDIIVFESPADEGIDVSRFNAYDCAHKPARMVRALCRAAESEAGRFKYSASDVPMWENIAALWRAGHNVQLHNIDAPAEVYHEGFPAWLHMYPCAMKNWLWWVRIYLREKYMAAQMRTILAQHTGKKRPTVAAFIENFHWIHVKFLLTNPTKDEIWEYYFGKRHFREVNRKTITGEIRKANRVFYKHWKKISDFA